MRWGSCDYRQLQKLRDKIAKLQSADMQKFCSDVSKELAARLLALVIPRTPVGRYPKESGKKGGTLRRGWTARTEAEAVGRGGSSDAKAYAQALPVVKHGTNYTIQVINPVHYASYVEFGHVQEPGRFVPAIGKRLKRGWVDGKYFLTLSEQDLERLAPAVIERRLQRLLTDLFSK